MTSRKKNLIFLFLNILLPLIAIGTLGVSSYLWYRVLMPETIPPPPVVSRSETNPNMFSAELSVNLTRVMSDFGVDDKDIKRRKADDIEDGLRHIYTIRVPEKASLMLINLNISIMAKDMGGSVFQGIESSSGTVLTITLGASKKPTDVVIFKKTPDIELKRAKMAIIIDDVGVRNPESAKKLCALDQVVTLSILPFRPHTSQVVELAKETETPYMLHMPMEPKSSKANPGEGVLLADDEKEVIIEKLTKAFRSVRDAGGLNNHMGSKATENVRTMEIVMEFLRDNNLFFIDSKTSLNTSGYTISNRLGVKSAIIDGYLDVDNDSAAIEKNLERLAQKAFITGWVIVIGHDRPNTLAVLEGKLPELEKRGIRFVGALKLIR